jgi:hypothetical protein
MSDKVHALVTWTPSAGLDPDAARGVSLWAEILEKFENDRSQCYCWWGKVSVGGDLGMTQEDVQTLSHQLELEKDSQGSETHLYIYSADPKQGRLSLHVGLLSEIRGKDDQLRYDLHSPMFFQRLENYPIPFWFKLTDIRVIAVKRMADLLLHPGGNEFDPNTKTPMPHLVTEKPHTKTFFAEKLLKEGGWRHWWKEILYGGPANFPPIHKMISVEDGSDYNYQNLFAEYLKKAKEIKIVDPYVRQRHQKENVLALLGLIRQPRGVRVQLLTMHDEGMEANSRRLLDDLKDELLRQGFEFNWAFDPSIHDRLIETERWEIYLGRGLDFISKGKTKKCNIFFVQK